MPSLLGTALVLAVIATAGPAEEPPAAAVLPRYVVERVAFVGLQRTREAAVRKHVPIAAGDVLDPQRVTVSRLRLSQLGWFSRVDTRVERGSERGQVVLVFEVVERNTARVSELFVGSTEAQQFYGGVGLAEHNFLGQGLFLHGAFVYGGSPAQLPLDPARFSLRLDFGAPEVNLGLPSRVSLGVSTIWIRGEELTCEDPECDAFDDRLGAAPRLRYERLGASVELGVRTSPVARLSGGVRAEHVHATSRGAETPARAALALEDEGSTLAALTAGWTRDTRDDLFFPRDGTRFDLRATLASRAFGSDHEYSRWTLEGEAAFRPWRDHGLRLQGLAGVVQGDAPFFERFYAADLAYFSLGPALGRALELNFSTDSRYDAVAAMLGAEWGVPLWSGGRTFHRGHLALGTRWVHTTAQTGEWGRTRVSRSPLSAEVALRFDTVIGSFNLSAGYALDNFQ